MAMKNFFNPRVWIGRRPEQATLDSVVFRAYHGPKLEDFKGYSLKSLDQALLDSNFNSSLPTVFYFHGYVEKITDEHLVVIVDAYQSTNNHNLILVDWSDMADGSYPFDAVPNAKELGNAFGEKLVEIVEKGFPLETIHLVGHSLGGQLVGYVGRRVQEKSKGKLKIKRITALDPAFPGFYPAITGIHLSASDAEFVDIIHTDSWFYGSPAKKGTADFWPNGGKTLQPGCPRRNYIPLSDIDLASHRRSWLFWAESIKTCDNLTFHSVKCESWNNFKKGVTLPDNQVVLMGKDCPLTASGDYYLCTNGQSPFSKGFEGIHYNKEKRDENKNIKN